MKHAGIFLCIAVVAWFPISSGCTSLSNSSKSVSKIVSSPITSVSRSSSPEDEYLNDVRDFTAAHVQSGGNADGLVREIGEIAGKHGVTDWENDESTYRGVGAGLAQAGRRQIEVDAFKENLATTPEQKEWLQDGYDSAK